jgi:hypothetical protein
LDADAALTVESKLHAAVRHVVPVNRQARAADVGTASDADAFAVRQFLVFVLPIGACDDFLNALAEAHRADAQVVGRDGVRFDEML